MQATINGTTIAWDEFGRGKPLVLVHGLGDDRHWWQFQFPVFSRDRRVIAYDVRGFGESCTGDADGTVEQLAADLAALLGHLGIGRADVVGFSMGGVIAQRFGIDYPAMAGALVIAASSCLINRAAATIYREKAELVRREGFAPLLRDAAEDAKGSFLAARPDLVDEFVGLRRGSLREPAGYVNAALAMAGLLERPLTDELAKIACPVLIIAGEQDSACPPKASQIIHSHLPGAELHILPAVRHLAHWENPDAWNALVLRFLGSA